MSGDFGDVSTDFSPSELDFLTGGGDDTGGGPSDNPGGDFSAPTYGLIDNHDGTFTDSATGAMYDKNGVSLGKMDPDYDPGSADSSGLKLSDLLKGIGGPGGLAGLLAPALAGLYQYKQNKSATQQLQQAAGQANDLIKGIYGGATDMYKPYVAMGQQAVSQLPGSVYQPMAGNFQPLGAGRGLTLGAMANKGR